MRLLSAIGKKYSSQAPLAIILLLYGCFGLSHIGSFITADEHYWVDERIPQYWNAWNTGKWKKTLINDKPGVSLALVSAPALLADNHLTSNCETKKDRFNACDPEKTSATYSAFRLPILLINGLLLIVIFFSVRAFSSQFVATAATGLIASSPYLVGFSQIINPDSLLWSSGAAALFAFIAFLKTNRLPFGIIAALTLTLAILSKYTAIVLIFFLPILVLMLHFIDPTFLSSTPRKIFFWTIGISAAPFLLFPLLVPGVLSSEIRIVTFLTAGTLSFLPWIGYMFLISILGIFSLFSLPSKTRDIVRSASSAMLRVIGIIFLILLFSLIIGRLALPSWPAFDIVPIDIKDLPNARYFLGHLLSIKDIIFLELAPLAYGTPFATLIFACLSIAFASFAPRRLSSPLTLILLTFISFYTIALGFSNILATPRYVILTFPIMALLAAIGMETSWGLLPDRLRTRRYGIIFGSCIFILSVGSLVSSAPYYANFSNRFLPERSFIAHSWGYGGYEAARYLNTLPDAKNTTIWSDYYGVCEFFVGHCLTAYTFSPDLAPSYYVLTYRGRLRYMSKYDRWEAISGLTAYEYYDRNDPIFSLSINGKEGNFVKVFKVEK